MHLNHRTTGWHWNRQAIAWFIALAVACVSWPLLARAEEGPQPGKSAIPVEAAPSPSDLAPSNQSPVKAIIPHRNLFVLAKEGGPVMIPILACSIIMLLFTFERLISLRRGRIIPKPFVKKFLHQLREGQFDREEALEFCQHNRSVIAAVFAAAVRKWGRPAVEVEQAILDAGERAANKLRRNLRLLNGVATVCPLLGLLGTVYGMITSFNEIANSDAIGRPELLAGGIGMALLATAFGLTIAIPSLVAYMYFLGRVDRLVMDIDALGQEVVSSISAEDLADRESRPRKKKAA